MSHVSVPRAIELAARLQQAGQYPAAEHLCHQVLALHPDQPETLHILGVVQHQTGRSLEAVETITRAIAGRPQSSEFRANLGVTLAGLKKYDQAISAYGQAIEISPQNSEAYNNLGIALAAQGNTQAAIEAYETALRIKSDRTDTMSNLAVALTAKKEYERAMAYCRRAIQLRPDNADAYNNLGFTLLDLRKLNEASDAFRAAVKLQPDHARAYNNLASAQMIQGDIDAAIDNFRVAIRLNPHFLEAMCNLGLALGENGRLDDAAAIYEEALQINPQWVDAHWNMACLLLLRGDFVRGWREYEWRWRTNQIPEETPHYGSPQWYGQDLQGRTILLHVEQGFGDTIQFIRYATLVAAQGARVLLHCRPELDRLLRSAVGIDQIIVEAAVLQCDFHCPLMTLPLIFQTTLTSIPAPIPYLAAEPVLIEAWRERIRGIRPGDLKVGLVWAGGPAFKNDLKRSMTLAHLEPLSRTSGVTFYSLQKGEAASQAARPPPGMHLIDLAEDLVDFADTAAAIADLDLVIAVDTAVAHLAGAMGKPVWLMIPLSPDWRWMLERDDSPWYPTMRLFRQTKRGDWAEVAQRVAAALEGLRNPSAVEPDGSIDPDAPRQVSLADAIALGREHHQAGRIGQAGRVYRQILAQHPNNVEVLRLMADAAMEAAKPPMAVQCLLRALSIEPSRPDLALELGLALAATNEHPAAIKSYQHALSIQADHPWVQFNLGNALLKTGKFYEAVDAYRAAIALEPSHCDSHINLGDALAQSGRHAEALESFGLAIRLKPDHADAHRNVALALMELRRLDEALAAARRAIEFDPRSADSHWMLAALHLLRGEFQEGWPEYEWRWRGKDAPNIPFREPRWQGSDLKDRSILLHAEQGLGDSIQFIRYAPLITERQTRVIVQCPPALKRLFRGVAGIDTIITPEDPLPFFELHCPLLSLPLAFATKIETIPRKVPYIKPDPNLVENWRGKITGGKNLKVGLVWAGGTAYKDDHKRSMPLSCLAPLGKLQNVDFFSLQKGPAASQIANSPDGMNLNDFTEEFTDFADTAAMMVHLDLVIAVDTAVAHLAGAVGTPVWLMIPFNPDWRWMLDRQDTPWYPTMRLFRQKTRGDWPEVVARIAAALAERMKRGGKRPR